MGFSLNSLFEPGMTSELPSFIQRPSQEIGNRIGNILNRPTQRTFNPTEEEGVQGLIRQAQAGNPFLGQSTNFLQGLFQSGGLNQAETGLAGGLIGGEAINPAAGETARIAFGGELGQNPFLESQFNRAANVVGENFRENIVPGLDNEYAAAGRSGSRRYAGERNRAEDAYGRQINDLANQVFGGQYNQDLARRDQALGQLGQYGQQDVQNRLSGAGLFQQGLSNVFQGLGQTGAIDQQRFTDPERLLQAGGIIQQRPFVPLQTGANILAGLQGTPTTNTNPLGQLFGLGTQLANSFAQGFS